MRRLAAGTRLVVATHNPGKLAEISALVRPFGLDAVSADKLGLSEPEETEATFAGNARLKAVAAAETSGMPALSDDSGLAVECLGGAPGIYSARWAGPSKDFAMAMKRVADAITRCDGWTELGPRATFICALCLAMPGATPEIFEGRIDGRLVWPPRGTRGFGYDPMFQADGMPSTFGELDPELKHAISHRARAFQQFVRDCLGGNA